MKFYFGIPSGLRKEVNKEISLSNEQIKTKNWELAWSHLERAHILGQSSPYQHSRIHWKMLLFAFRIKNRKEIFGQLPRLLVGGIKSFIGEIPVGNTGGANVPALKSFDIPTDLSEILKKHLADDLLYQKI